MEKLDLIVLGATGFTGKHVVKNLALLKNKPEYSDLSWGISGRSKEKLQDLLNELVKSGVNTSNIPVIESDIKVEDSLRKVAKRAKVLMNCTGPYTVLGEPVVKACIEAGTHYVDISAELHHMLEIYRTYNKAAEDANVLIITACGFASIPVMTGLIHLQRQFKGVLDTVECYVDIEIPKRAYIPGFNKCLVNYGTWVSFVHELRNYKKYVEMKKNTFPNDIIEPEPADNKRSFFHKHNGRLWYPYPGPDHDIVEMTQRYLWEKKAQKPFYFNIYTTMPLLIHFFVVVPAFFFYYYASYFKCFSKLLWKFPGFFTLGYMTHKGPSQEMMNDTKFSFTLTGKGRDNYGEVVKPSPNKSLTVKVSGSDPGYRSTSKALIFSAITVLKEYSKMPKGGVITTGAIFYDTKIIERLNNEVLTYEIL